MASCLPPRHLLSREDGTRGARVSWGLYSFISFRDSVGGEGQESHSHMTFQFISTNEERPPCWELSVCSLCRHQVLGLWSQLLSGQGNKIIAYLKKSTWIQNCCLFYFKELEVGVGSAVAAFMGEMYMCSFRCYPWVDVIVYCSLCLVCKCRIAASCVLKAKVCLPHRVC